MMDALAPTRLADSVASRFRYGYFSVRLGMLIVTGGSLCAWGLAGFNVVEGGVPLIGIQWSTFATFSFFFYLLMVNFQVGGLDSFAYLKAEFKYDLAFLRAGLSHPRKAREAYNELREPPVVDALRAAMISLLVCMSALFLFEAIWVPLYDYFQFGSVMWPVYFAVTSFPPVMLRNVGLFVLPLLIACRILGLTLDSPTRQRFQVKWRLDFGAVMVLFVAASLWLVWIAFPSQIVNISTLSGAAVMGIHAAAFNPSSCYVWPSQHLFPQNTYTFYPCAIKGVSYVPSQILGFFAPGDVLHAVNVLTKFATFGALCYPAMAIVRRSS